jgi:hypothetical protein
VDDAVAGLDVDQRHHVFARLTWDYLVLVLRSGEYTADQQQAGRRNSGNDGEFSFWKRTKHVYFLKSVKLKTIQYLIKLSSRSLYVLIKINEI